MATSQIQNQNQRQVRSPVWKQRRIEKTTLVVLAVATMTAIVLGGWITGQEHIVAGFAWLNAIQRHPPVWIQIPDQPVWLLAAPTLVLLFVVTTIKKCSPCPTFWSRLVVVGILLFLLGRYVVWRSLSTLNLADPINGGVSLSIFALELIVISSTSLQLALMLLSRDRRSEANELSRAVLEGTFTPSVDVLIPTYDEPTFILKRTVVGCQAMAYPNKTIYLLDDTHRPEVKALAYELGCRYMTRPNNLHAKAGNLNHAIAQSQGELILVFDADFVPTQNFLTRTVGFFQRSQVAMVQTPQTFYNPDPIARNLGLEDILTPEEEVFYRQIQPMRDGAGGVICAGTSFVVRRSALEALGGFVTESLSEDYFTGVRLAAEQHQLIYLDEKLSAGLAAEGIAAQALQRLRWAQGTLQAFFISSSPLTVKGLKPLQRLAHLEGILYWFTSLARLSFLVLPLTYLLFGLIPIYATLPEAVYFFVPYYLVQLAAFSWLNHQSRSALLSEIYSLVLCFPLAYTVLKAFIQPFGSRFRVTPKGTSRDRYTFNWGFAYPLIAMLAITLFSFGFSLYQSLNQPDFSVLKQEFNLGWIWSVYNITLLSISLLILCDAPQPYAHDWFNLRRIAHLSCAAHAPETRPVSPTATAQPLSTQVTQSKRTHEWDNAATLSLDQDLPQQLPLTLKSSSSYHVFSSCNKFSSTIWGMTTMLSEGGAEIELATSQLLPLLKQVPIGVHLTLVEENLHLSGRITQTRPGQDFSTMRIMFNTLPLSSYRQLIQMLFCRPGQWKSRQSPGEWRSLLLIFQILMRPRFLCDRHVDIKAVQVAQS